jgi:hypothetical protein
LKKVGIILSSSLVTKELELDFGRITPSELPLGNKHLFHYQEDYLGKYCDEVYVTQPIGHKTNLKTDKIVTVNADFSLLETISYVLDLFEGSMVVILFGDTLVEHDLTMSINQKRDIVFTHENIEFSYDWTETIERQIIIGLFIFINHFNVKESLNSSSKFGDFILSISEFSLFEKSFNWMDFGQKRTYSYNKIKYLETRGFNSISYSKGYVTKKSSDWFKMYAEYKWMHEVQYLSPEVFTPVVRDFNSNGDVSSYNIEYKDFISLSDKFIFGNFNIEGELNILSSLINFLTIIKNQIPLIEVNDNFISNKLKLRFNELEASFLKDFRLNEIYLQTHKYFENKILKYGFFHGDICFSNVLYNNIDGVFYLLDPRGYLDREDGFSMRGPVNYDLYKLAHSFVCGYDKIIAFNEVVNIDDMRLRFQKFLNLTDLDSEELKFGLIQLFISMIPLHADHKVRQNCFAETVQIIWDNL